jgi:hypothetical protein
MGFLRKKGPKPAEVTQYTGLQIQTSSDAVPIAIVYGNNKVAPNLLWYGDFLSVPEYSKTKSGGKGGGNKQTLSGYHYYAGVILGLCEGPIVSVSSVTKDQGQYSAAALNFSLVQGYGSSPTLAYQSDISYKGVAYVVSASYDLGSSATIGSLQFELSGLLQSTAAVNARDADPAWIIYDFLTSEQYGVGFPAGSIDAATLFAGTGHDYQTYCWAARIALSPVLSNRESGNAILARWLQLTNSAAVWSEGKLKLIPYADETVYGYLYDSSPVTFNSNLTPVYDLTDDDFVIDGPEDDPVVIERKDPYSVHNVQEIEISDRAKNYNSATITVWDQNSIELYGRRDGSTITAHEICDKAIAQTVAQLILQREVYIRNTYTFKLSFEYCLLEPMDIVTLTDSSLGLDQAAVRIISIEEDDSGVLNVTAEEFTAGIGTASVYPIQGNEADVIDRNIVPSAVNAPVIFEPPSSLVEGDSQAWLAISGGLASTRLLEEDGTTGVHSVSATMVSQAAGTWVEFAAYVKADERVACRLRIHDGSTLQSVSFALSGAGLVSGATAGIKLSSIEDQHHDGWFLVSITCAMAVTAAPVVSIALENPLGTASYAGTAGNGIFVWNPQFGWTTDVGAEGAPLSIISTPMTPSAATFAADAQDPPAGAEGSADPYWGGCIVYVSTDDVTYGQVGQINGPSRHGKVVSDFGTSISVDLVASDATLDPATPADAANGVTLSLVGNELLAYGGATLTAPPKTYSLSNLARGLYGTTNVAHSAGDRFARLDDAIFKYSIPPAYVGKTLYLKFQSFNIFGQGLQDLSTCATYTFVPTGLGSSILDLLSRGFSVSMPSITTAGAIAEPMPSITETPSETVRLQGLS